MHKRINTRHHSCCYFIRLHCTEEQIQAQLMTQDHRALLGLPPATCFLTQNIFSFLLNTPWQGTVGKQRCIWCLQHSNVLFSLFFTSPHLPNLFCSATSLVLDNLQGMEMTVCGWGLLEISSNGWSLADLVCLHSHLHLCDRAHYPAWPTSVAYTKKKERGDTPSFPKATASFIREDKGCWKCIFARLAPNTCSSSLTAILLSSGATEWRVLKDPLHCFGTCRAPWLPMLRRGEDSAHVWVWQHPAGSGFTAAINEQNSYKPSKPPNVALVRVAQTGTYSLL